MHFINFVTKFCLFLFRTSALTSIQRFLLLHYSITVHYWHALCVFCFFYMKGIEARIKIWNSCIFSSPTWLISFPWAGLPVPRPDVIFHLKKGDEPWIADFHGSEEKECARSVSLGNWVWTGHSRALFYGHLGVGGKEYWVSPFSQIQIFCINVNSLSPISLPFFPIP